MSGSNVCTFMVVSSSLVGVALVSSSVRVAVACP